MNGYHESKLFMRTGKKLDWYTIHRIKTLYDDGKALSMNQISKELGIAKHIVKQYLAMDVEELVSYLKKQEKDEKLKP